MRTKFQYFLNENQEFISVKEIGQILSWKIIPELEGIEMDKDDVELFHKSTKFKTYFEITLYFNEEYEDIHHLLKSCDFIYNIYSLNAASDLVIPFWIDMGNGLTTIALEYGSRKYSIFKIYSGEANFDKYLRNLEERLELEYSAKKYNL